MESKQKYIEEEFEVDEFFLKQLDNFKFGSKNKIADIVDRISGVCHTSGNIENKTGQVNDNNGNPVFFCIDYFREKEGPIRLIDIYDITVNQYLDSINLNKHIK